MLKLTKADNPGWASSSYAIAKKIGKQSSIYVCRPPNMQSGIEKCWNSGLVVAASSVTFEEGNGNNFFWFLLKILRMNTEAIMDSLHQNKK